MPRRGGGNPEGGCPCPGRGVRGGAAAGARRASRRRGPGARVRGSLWSPRSLTAPFAAAGNQERGWNDPPQFSYGLQAGGPRRTPLTRRAPPPAVEPSPGQHSQSPRFARLHPCPAGAAPGEPRPLAPQGRLRSSPPRAPPALLLQPVGV